jgi:adenylylsulfate kinase
MTPKSRNITWAHSAITREMRAEKNGHHSTIIWFTGLSGSGKSTLTRRVEEKLFGQGCQTYILDGDNVRFGLNKDLGFSPEDRTENIRRIGEVSKLMLDSGAIVLTAFISPYRTDRDVNRELVDSGDFIEVFTKCSLEECEKRDPKGLYKKARSGEIPNFTGISAPYEEPLSPEIVIETDKFDVDECADQVIAALQERGIFNGNKSL